MSKKIIIIGAGSGGKIVKDICYVNNQEVEGFFDDYISIKTKIMDAPIIGKINLIEDQSFLQKFSFIVTMSNHLDKRSEIISYLTRNNASFSNAIHPKSTISSYSKIGEGLVINAFSTILPGAKLGNHVFIDNHCSVGIDCNLEDNLNLATGVHITARAVIKSNTFLGTCTTVLPNTTIHRNSFIGAGTLVTGDISENSLAYGSPAKVVGNSPWNIK